MIAGVDYKTLYFVLKSDLIFWTEWFRKSLINYKFYIMFQNIITLILQIYSENPSAILSLFKWNVVQIRSCYLDTSWKCDKLSKRILVRGRFVALAGISIVYILNHDSGLLFGLFTLIARQCWFDNRKIKIRNSCRLKMPSSIMAPWQMRWIPMQCTTMFAKQTDNCSRLSLKLILTYRTALSTRYHLETVSHLLHK